MFLKQKQQGSSLVIAIFIIVVMSVLAAVLARVLSASSAAIVDEVAGTRALQAANSGAQVFLTDLFPPGTDSASHGACNSGRNIDFNAPGLNNCSARVNCALQDYSDDYGMTHFRITSTGECLTGNREYSRQIIVEAVDGNF
ncbi:hypothetical protein CWE09_08240 [Aliidiomarina minuta]|uniref:Type II secretory pathway component n=1 Tax=Aliidiomarina minuta TaxID=880057 RepID=A0A432W9L9_9GAMM|nr:hypothetical protein [Aliidiomarina minuta]RUO26676.1 hypothetical protein CWE09_08240 [Aliidiomarina minuta]